MPNYPSQKTHVLFDFTLKSDEAISQHLVVWLLLSLCLIILQLLGISD